MSNPIPPFILQKGTFETPIRKRGVPLSYLDRGLHALSQFLLTSYMEWETASQSGLFQKIDSRIKIFFLIYFIVIVSLLKSLTSEMILGILIFFLGIFSRLPLVQFYKKILIPGGIFGFLIPLPSALNLFTPGESLFPLFPLPKFFMSNTSTLPEIIGMTQEGLLGVLMITCRVINSLSITLLVIYTTPFSEIMRGFNFFRLPWAIIMVMTLTYKYLFLFVKMVQEMYLARKARFMGGEKGSAMRSWVVGRMVFILQRSQGRFEEIYRAMVSRGFTGKAKIPFVQPLHPKDLLAGILLLLVGILFLFL